MTVELIEERNVILTSSQDRTVRLWTKNCTYIGTFGEHWRPLPPLVGAVVESKPRIPKDLLRCASARSLGTLHNGAMPHWKVACTAVRRHILELHREKQIEEAREKLKQERRERGEPTSDDDEVGGEKPASKVLGRCYQPKHRYKGPLTTQALGFPELKLFSDKCAPYSSIPPRDFYPMVPLYSQTTLIDIDSRRRKKNKRQLRQSPHFRNYCNFFLPQFSIIPQRAADIIFRLYTFLYIPHTQQFKSDGKAGSEVSAQIFSMVIFHSAAIEAKWKCSKGDHGSSDTPNKKRHENGQGLAHNSSTNSFENTIAKKKDESANRPVSPLPNRGNVSSHNMASFNENTSEGTSFVRPGDRPRPVSPPRNFDTSDGTYVARHDPVVAERSAKRVAFQPSFVSDEIDMTDIECERHCYSERCGLPPLVHAPGHGDFSSTNNAAGINQVDWMRDSRKQLGSRSVKKSIDHMVSAMEERNNRMHLLSERKQPSCEGSLLDGGSSRSNFWDTSYNRATTNAGLSSVPQFPASRNRSFINPENDENAKRGIDPGILMYQQTRDMLEQARKCLANPEDDYLIDRDEGHTFSEPTYFSDERDANLVKSSAFSDRRLTSMASDDVSLYLARKARYAQAIKLNYKGNQ
ncbi:WD repeat-containing protein on Y chromosome [Elysia marginata]|uniref:WD repeat-containing protein on Y chromosome n=1 Tax=Elysia marginata TaxID=1093978 RepID=A0AAV4IA98_9GAST|nr:WD repeat-containing protein on Y chromosome [Elysia marginata]